MYKSFYRDECVSPSYIVRSNGPASIGRKDALPNSTLRGRRPRLHTSDASVHLDTCSIEMRVRGMQANNDLEWRVEAHSLLKIKYIKKNLGEP